MKKYSLEVMYACYKKKSINENRLERDDRLQQKKALYFHPLLLTLMYTQLILYLS